VADAVTRILERLAGLGLEPVLMTALLAGVGVLAVANLGRGRRPSRHHAHRDRQRRDDQ
jgi:hypothetical protein